jgi:hypothetical protein
VRREREVPQQQEAGPRQEVEQEVGRAPSCHVPPPNQAICYCARSKCARVHASPCAMRPCSPPMRCAPMRLLQDISAINGAQFWILWLRPSHWRLHQAMMRPCLGGAPLPAA